MQHLNLHLSSLVVLLALAAVFCVDVSAETLDNRYSIKAFREETSNSGNGTRIAGALWVDNTTDRYYFSDGINRPLHYLFTFDRGLAGGHSGVYSATVLPNGDVLFVYRTEFASGSTTNPTDAPRRNPVLYVAAEGYTPVVIDFGDSVKPSGWLQNVGVCRGCADNRLFIAEYTRANLPMARCWRVDEPISDPANWHIALEHEIVHPYGSGFKHYHTAQRDAYTNTEYFTSGDDDTSSGIWASTDDGQSFAQLGETDRKRWRMLNMVFTPEYIFWASDDWSDSAPNHTLWRASRDSAGVLDPESLVEVYNFRDLDRLSVTPGSYMRLATYSTSYFSKYNALLLLDRDDAGTHNSIQIRVYDIDEDSLYVAATVAPAANAPGKAWGFRCETVELYPEGDEMTISFGRNYENRIDVLGNPAHNALNQLNVIKLRLTKDANGYHADFAPLNYEIAPVVAETLMPATGTVTLHNVFGDTITEAAAGETVFATVAPAGGYYAEPANVTAMLAIDPRLAQAPAGTPVIVDEYFDIAGTGFAYANNPVEDTLTMPECPAGTGVLVLADFQPCIDIAEADIAPIPAQYYTGEPLDPGLTISFCGKALAAGTDYDAVYSDNTAFGTATVTVTGCRRYTGSVAAHFAIYALRGDINLDGRVDVSDLNLLVNVVLGTEPPDTYEGRADLNSDGTVDVGDLNLMVNLLLDSCFAH